MMRRTGCIQLFSVEGVVTHLRIPLDNFLRHYNSYKYAYSTTQPEETVHHDLIVETPLPPPPLSRRSIVWRSGTRTVREAQRRRRRPTTRRTTSSIMGRPRVPRGAKAYVRGRRLDAERQEDPSLTKAREDAMAMLAQLKADEEAGG